MVVCRGRVGLTAENWPSDKASSLQALTGNGARVKALGWLAQPELGRARPGAGWRLHRDGERKTEQGKLKRADGAQRSCQANSAC